jgi:death-on-curing protein
VSSVIGVRDGGLLESALSRPQTGHYDDVIEEAAAVCKGLLQNHPFIDGNKRSAVVATAVSLPWNGYKLQFLDRGMYDLLMSRYQTGSVNKRTLDAWLRAHAAEV